MSDFTVGQQLLKTLLRQLKGRSILALAPKAVLHPQGNPAGGFTQIELRQLFVLPESRRSGVGRAALQWLWLNAWPDVQHLRVDVLVANTTAREFWRSVGFQEYCITMEAKTPNARS